MICDLCKQQEASVFIELNGNSVNKKLNICQDCASKLGVNNDTKSLASIFREIAGTADKISEADRKACPVCGTRFAAIKTHWQVGCPECYSIFKQEILSNLKKNGLKGSYTGSMPKRLSTFRSVLTDRIALQTKLEESLKREDYEKAAVYRDYLKALEKSPVSGSDDE